MNQTQILSELLRLHRGTDEFTFVVYLAEHFYDLHYAPVPGAQPFSFGLGNLWQHPLGCPGSPVPPCIHRAADVAGDGGEVVPA